MWAHQAAAGAQSSAAAKHSRFHDPRAVLAQHARWRCVHGNLLGRVKSCAWIVCAQLEVCVRRRMNAPRRVRQGGRRRRFASGVCSALVEVGLVPTLLRRWLSCPCFPPTLPRRICGCQSDRAPGLLGTRAPRFSSPSPIVPFAAACDLVTLLGLVPRVRRLPLLPCRLVPRVLVFPLCTPRQAGPVAHLRGAEVGRTPGGSLSQTARASVSLWPTSKHANVLH